MKDRTGLALPESVDDIREEYHGEGDEKGSCFAYEIKITPAAVFAVSLGLAIALYILL